MIIEAAIESREMLDRTHRYHSVTTHYTDEAEASKKANVIGAELRAGTFRPDHHFAPASPRFGAPIAPKPKHDVELLPDAVRAWIDKREKRPNVPPSRIRDYRSHLENYIEDRLARLPSSGLTKEILEDFQLWLLTQAGEDEDGLSEKTAANVIRGTLRAFVRDAGGNLVPFDKLDWERYVPQRQQDPFEPTERDGLLAWFKARRPVDEYTSLRLRFIRATPSETRGLHVGDFDRATRTVTILRKEHLGKEGPTKTRARERVVELGDVARDVSTLCGLRDPNQVLLDVAEDTLRDNFAKAQTALGIRPRSLYQAKHTYAVHALLDGPRSAQPRHRARYAREALRGGAQNPQIAPRIAPSGRVRPEIPLGIYVPDGILHVCTPTFSLIRRIKTAA